mmetsp:Transcript_9200/g.18349  ORF Transcript_9200/g.18349 Transcript_9200/m.18349 type:complete len:281 (+) Transcript_9200:181-1023(+)|eukprot:CAMPEP_0181292708 /NCGR_PEP_ID=MMETSP1101-20121128/2660_1 /TAXON_ID=46948 /ORGANISM="Rhodomonas abbreviata, Strain Caron Lab Isolate" /LENGTH=280 /DNA_ID=CAMNT_0023397215 /DNA_START=168 /DNA_END=1010 /DNA_ORIENTATION=+
MNDNNGLESEPVGQQYQEMETTENLFQAPNLHFCQGLVPVGDPVRRDHLPSMTSSSVSFFPASQGGPQSLGDRVRNRLSRGSFQDGAFGLPRFDGLHCPSPPPSSPAQFCPVSSCFGYDAACSSSGGNGVEEMLEDDAWLDMRRRTPVANVGEHGRRQDAEEASSTINPQYAEVYDYDCMQEDQADGDGHNSCASRTLSKWEQLLQTQPRDPMAFYWREMIHWCKARGRHGGGSDSESAGVKRCAQGSEEAMLEESVDLLNRLVKRCRCNDDVVGEVSTL